MRAVLNITSIVNQKWSKAGAQDRRNKNRSAGRSVMPTDQTQERFSIMVSRTLIAVLNSIRLGRVIEHLRAVSGFCWTGAEPAQGSAESSMSNMAGGARGCPKPESAQSDRASSASVADLARLPVGQPVVCLSSSESGQLIRAIFSSGTEQTLAMGQRLVSPPLAPRPGRRGLADRTR